MSIVHLLKLTFSSKSPSAKSVVTSESLEGKEVEQEGVVIQDTTVLAVISPHTYTKRLKGGLTVLQPQGTPGLRQCPWVVGA